MDQAADTTAREFGPIKTATINGTTLAYREEGQGEPVVFVHGAVSDLRTWKPQLPEIGRLYRAIAYSRRYHRPNKALEPGARDPWEPHADDLAAFLREIGASPAHLVGNSQGAYISLCHRPANTRGGALPGDRGAPRTAPLRQHPAASP